MIDHHAKLCRTLRRIGVGLALLGGLPLMCHAAYTQLTPPPGWVAGAGAAATYQPPAAAAWVNSKAIADAAIASASGTSKVRVSLGIEKAAAQRALASRVGTALLGGPGSLLVTGLALGAAAALPEMVEWATKAALRWNAEKHMYEMQKEEACSGICLEWYGQWSPNTPVRKSMDQASFCRELAADGGQGFIGTYEDGCVFERAGNRPFSTRYVDTGGVKWVPAPTDTVVHKLGETPMPAKLPNIVWPNSWPVQDPVINPDSTGKPQPLFIPTGNPVKNPKFDPAQPVSSTNQPYLQPGIRVVPAPAPGKPWQVDVQPVDRPVDSAEPKPEPEPDPQPNPDDQPREDDRDLCERNPDILACAKPELDTPDGEIPKKTVDVSYQPENLFGGGSCPADKTMTAHGVQLKVWDWQQGCGYITSYVRPVILVLCACVAMAIIAGGAKS